MKKKLNVIQIKGVRGLILAGMFISCLVAGFVAFPGWVCMNLWNYLASYSTNMPAIGMFQGILLWGILITSYFVFRKEKVVVCMRAPQGLSDEELKTVFAEMKKNAIEEPIIQAMMKAREAELKYKAQQEIDSKESEQKVEADSTKV